MLSCRDLVIRQGGKVLWQNLTFTISAGERVGIHAPSGTGKTTLGRVWPDGKADGGRRSAGRQPVTPASVLSGTACPQHPELTFNPRRSAGDAVRDARQPDPETMRRLHVQPEWLTRRPMQLSGGELARIAILRALDPRTRFLIADEMTAQLDPSIQKRYGYTCLRCAAAVH